MRSSTNIKRRDGHQSYFASMACRDVRHLNDRIGPGDPQKILFEKGIAQSGDV